MPVRRLIKWEDLFDLVLDADNPRHDPGMTRREIIQYLVAKESVLNLAKDIVLHGLSPLDLFGGVQNEDGDIVIVEGNRRLCSLILLFDPSLAPIKERPAFELLHQDLDSNLEIEVTIFADQSEADTWIERKHSGLADGIGPRPWTSPQKARHYGARSGNALALALLDFAETEKLITPTERQGRIITTVTRFVSNPYVRRSGLGIHTGRNDPEFKFDGTKALFKKRLSILLRDIITGANGATSRTTVTEREDYARVFLLPVQIVEGSGETSASTSGGVSDSDERNARPNTSDNSSSEESESNASEGDETQKANGAGGGSHPGKRLKLIPPTFVPDIKGQKLQRVLLELKECRRSSPIATALLVRVFIEAICVTYLENGMGYVAKDNDKLHFLMHKALEHIDGRRKGGQIELTKAQQSALHSLKGEVGQPSFVYSAAYLGRVAHGHAFPEWGTLTSKWDEIESIVEYLADNCEQSPGV